MLYSEIDDSLIIISYVYDDFLTGGLKSGLVHWTQVLVLSECGFESRYGWSLRLCP